MVVRDVYVTVYLQLRSGVCPAKVVDDGSAATRAWWGQWGRVLTQENSSNSSGRGRSASSAPDGLNA